MTWAIFFPGQGSQSVGMLSALAEQTTVIKQRFIEASAALGYDVWQLVQQGPEEKLNQTEFTQPALLTASVAVMDAWRELGGNIPSLMLGHSLGEYSALVCAGSIEFADAVRLVAVRGKAMQDAVAEGQGAMAAVLGLSAEVVADLCADVADGAVLTVANRNSIGQVVVAGEAAAVDRLVEVASKAGAKRVMPLPVSVPAHCALMQPAQEPLRAALADINVQMPSVEIWHNATLGVADSPDAIRQALVEQLVAPVPWVELIQKAYSEGVHSALECGPAKVLTGLNRRIERALLTYPGGQPDLLKKAFDSIEKGPNDE